MSHVSRRGFIAAGAAAAAVTAVTLGQSVQPLAPAALLAPRVAGLGPQGVPINRTAAQAGVSELATHESWALVVRGGGALLGFTLSQLRALTPTTASLPLACVEGWSTVASWTGVPLRDLVAMTGIVPTHGVRISSLQPSGNFRRTDMPREFVMDPATLVALELNGETLSLDHGYPARIIAPGRPGVLQTKWLAEIEVFG